MVWSNVPGTNTHRGAEGDNTQRRAEQAGIKRSTNPSADSAALQHGQPHSKQPAAVAHHSSRQISANNTAAFDTSDCPGTLKTKVIGGNTVVRFNNQYCPELGVAMALARQEVFGSQPAAGTADLITSRPAPKAFETFTDVPRLVDTLSLLRRHAPSDPHAYPTSAPLHHFQHGFGSLRTIRPNMSSPAPGWYYYGQNKAVGTTGDLGSGVGSEGVPPDPRPASCCAAAHPHSHSQAVQTTPSAAHDCTARQVQTDARQQDQLPIQVPRGSCLDTASMLQLLHQQRDESPPPGREGGSKGVSVGCQTRQGDSWRVHSEPCQAEAAEEAGCWAHHDKAWVPAGTHYLDKQAHDALAPKRPPNSPQGNKCPSPVSSRRCRSPASSSRKGRAAPNSPSWPPWNMYAVHNKEPARAVRSSPCSSSNADAHSPSSAALKKMTASWSPGRQGFVKPELAQKEGNAFSHSSKVNTKGRPDKGNRRASPAKRAASTKAMGQGPMAGSFPAKTGSGGSIWEGTLAGPQTSFLQPILHSSINSALPNAIDSPDSTQLNSQVQEASKPVARKKRRSKSSSQHARTRRQQASLDEESALDSGSETKQSSSVIYTLDQSPRGSYISPLKRPSQRVLSERHSPSSLVVLQQQAQHALNSKRSIDFLSGSEQARSQELQASSLSARSSELSAQSLAAGSSILSPDCSCCDDSDAHSLSRGSQASGEGGTGDEEDGRWSARSMRRLPEQQKGREVQAAGRKAETRKLDGGKAKGGRGKGRRAGSVSSSGLRREVQDSLGELERLIEQQHRQLIARGILVPEEPSSASVSASDLDFSTLSLDSGMDRLSRLADSLVQGMTPASLSAAQESQGVHQGPPSSTGAPRQPQHYTRLGSAQSAQSDSGLKQAAQTRFESRQGAQHAVAEKAASNRSSKTQLRAAERAQPQHAQRSRTAGSSAAASPWSQKLPGNCHSDDRLLEGSDVHLHANDDAIRSEHSSACLSSVRAAADPQKSFSASDTAQAHSKRHAPGSSVDAQSIVPERQSHADRSAQMSEASLVGPADTASPWHHSLAEAQRMSCAEQAHSSTERDSSQSAYPLSKTLAQSSTQAWRAGSQPMPRARAAPSSKARTLCDASGVSASEASSPELVGSYVASGQKSQDEPACSRDDLSRDADSSDDGKSVVSEQQQQEGLLSDSENELERSIESARMLRPMAAADRSASTHMHAEEAAHPVTVSAQYSLKMQAGDNQAVAFSTIFRQTPTNHTAAEGHSEACLEESSDFGESEYSGGLSGEPSAAHWADLQGYRSDRL